MRSHRRKNIPSMKSGGNFGTDHPIRIRDLANAVDAVAVLDQRHEAVVGQHKQLSSLRFHHDRLARTSHPRIDHDYENGPRRKVGRGPKQKSGAILNRKWIDLMRQVDNPETWSDSIHHSLAQRHRVIEYSKIGHKNNRCWRRHGRWLRDKIARKK